MPWPRFLGLRLPRHLSQRILPGMFGKVTGKLFNYFLAPSGSRNLARSLIFDYAKAVNCIRTA